MALQRQVGELALSNDRNQPRRLQLFDVMRERGGADGLTVVHRGASYGTIACTNLL